MRIWGYLLGLLALVLLGCVISASSPLSGSSVARGATAATDPVSNPRPASTLLAPGTTVLDITVNSAVATDCRWSLGTAKAYAAMTPFSSGAGTTSHRTRVTGLNPSPAVLNHVYVRCASSPSFVLSLIYRSIAKVNPSFPRTANLWGFGMFRGKSAKYLSRIDLWMFQSIWNGISADLARQLRSLNPDVILLDAFNAVETGGLPDDYYLHDIHGKKIEVWSGGDYRLDLTKPYVADYQAHLAYQLMVQNDLRYDGMFFDNVFTSQSWVTHDMWGNPVQFDTNGDGVADDPATFDAAWKAGVFREMNEFQRLMPYAIVNGHGMDIRESGIAERFNGLGIGFATADVLEHERTFAGLWDEYSAWMTTAVKPHISFFEGSPPDQIAYGYGYAPWDDTPASTLEFARTLYPYMRFALGLTLMNDGYFAYEFGDMWHGNNWWYDELNFNLGYPRGPANEVKVGAPVEEKLVPGGDFERAEVARPWSLWVDTANGYQSRARIDRSNPGAGNASARIDVTASAGEDWHTALIADGVAVKKGKSYDLTFLARADKARSISTDAQKSSPNWMTYGWGTTQLTTEWKRYTFNFESTGTDANARLQFMLGTSTGSVWIDDVHFYPHRPSIYRREFDNGLVLLNPTWSTRRIAVGKGWRRLKGAQAPRYEFLADDSQAGFKTKGKTQVKAYDSADHAARPPYFHSWRGKMHLLRGGASASWRLTIPAKDVYSIDAWWPAAPQSSGWSRAVTYQVLVSGKVIASRRLDQSSGGDRWHRLARVRLPAGKHTVVRLVCAGKRPCAADALYLRSKSRYNDGSVARTVRLAPMDAIVLRRAR
jgi:hypothetical protein